LVNFFCRFQTLLSDAITDLGTADADNAVALAGDIIYGNDAAAWLRAAYALKARYAMNLSKVNGSAAATEALGYLANAFTGNGDDFQFQFTSSQKNPFYLFMDVRGDIAMANTFMDMLNATADPRTSFYATDEGDGYIGSIPGSQGLEQGAISLPGSFIADEDSPTFFMTFAEQKFLEAEAEFMLNGGTAAVGPWQEGVAASVLKVTGDANTAWLDANINNVSTVTLEDIMNQKYLALIGQTQAYTDWRRTDYPTLNSVVDAKLPATPRRFPYPQSELDYNSNAPANVLISASVWWDQ